MKLKTSFIILMILLCLQIENIKGIPIYKKIPSIKERSKDKCEPYEKPIYKIDSCRLSCHIIFQIGQIYYYEESRLLTTNKSDGTFCTFMETGNNYYTSIKLSKLKRLEYGTCQLGICSPSKINNPNSNDHNNDDNIIENSNNIDKNIPSTSPIPINIKPSKSNTLMNPYT